MRVKVDMESDALYFRLCEDDVEDSEEIAPGIIIDYNKDDNVVGIEILVSRQPYNVVRYISYVPHIQLEGIKHEEIHRDAN